MLTAEQRTSGPQQVQRWGLCVLGGAGGCARNDGPAPALEWRSCTLPVICDPRFWGPGLKRRERAESRRTSPEPRDQQRSEETSVQLWRFTVSEVQRHGACPQCPGLVTELGPALRFLKPSSGPLLTPVSCFSQCFTVSFVARPEGRECASLKRAVGFMSLCVPQLTPNVSYWLQYFFFASNEPGGSSGWLYMTPLPSLEIVL